MNVIKVGYQYNNYNVLRSFAGLPFKNVVQRRCRDVSTLPRFLCYKIRKKISSSLYYKIMREFPRFLVNIHYDPGFYNVDIFHLFNSISFSHTPWVVTYETALPRWNQDSLLGIKRLANTSCKKIIALSRTAYDIQCRHLDKFPDFKDIICNKMMVVHPFQKAFIKTIREKELSFSGMIDFTFVGADFFRKGGREILQAFDMLLDKDYPIQLNIVSRLSYGDYASKTTRKDQQWAEFIIHKHPKRIRHFEFLPNREVNSLLKRTHVGLLPTYADTYGYSVLEAQSYGCPVITTDIRAFPEINNETIGWTIKVPKKNEFGYAKIDSQQERTTFSEILIEGLMQTIESICQNPELILLKGKLALEKINRQHNPENIAKVLEGIYREALQK